MPVLDDASGTHRHADIVGIAEHLLWQDLHALPRLAVPDPTRCRTCGLILAEARTHASPPVAGLTG